MQTQPTTTAMTPTRSLLAGKTWMQQTAAVVIGTALLALSAHVQVPFWPVPLSMQTFVVLVIGLACGSRLGAATVLAYLAEGAIGLPVFHGGAGLAYLAGPTGGYLIGFLPAAAVVGALTERGIARHRAGAAAALLLGELLMFLPGLAWLAVLFGPAKAIPLGLVPFLPAEAAKFALAMAIAPLLQQRNR